MSKVTYTVRGKERVLEKLDGIRAIFRGKKEEAPYPGFEEDMSAFKFEKQKLDFRQAALFENAGWEFIRVPEDATEGREGVDKLAEVYLDENKNLLIGTNTINIKLNPKIDKKGAVDILAAEKLEVIQKYKFSPNTFLVKVPKGTSNMTVVESLFVKDEFVFVEPEFIQIIPTRNAPTDPDYPRQWQWKNNLQIGADVSAEDGWTIATGKGVTIAVIDLGMDILHWDLFDSLTPQTGYFGPQGNAPSAPFIQSEQNFPMDRHGTFCAGMALARANNDEAGCGAAFDANFTAIACLEDSIGTQSTLARAVAYAADPSTEIANADPSDGADVISCSLGPSIDDTWIMESILQDAIDYAVQHGRGGLGTPIFWAVTNGDHPLSRDEVVSHPSVIAVGMSTRKDKHALTGYGDELDFLAPGYEVVSTLNYSGAGVKIGTSYAAPCAAGVAANVLSIRPQITWTELRQVLRDSCAKIGDLGNGRNRSQRYGYGRIDMYEALQLAKSRFLPSSVVLPR